MQIIILPKVNMTVRQLMGILETLKPDHEVWVGDENSISIVEPEVPPNSRRRYVINTNMRSRHGV